VTEEKRRKSIVSEIEMTKLPDLEGWAVFAKVAEARSFARAADELGLSKATASKAVSRLENRLGERLFHRSSRRLSLTETGRRLLPRAERMLAEAEAAEDEAQDGAAAPRGLIRLAAPMSFGVLHVGPALADFLQLWPEVSVEASFSDEAVDLIGEGFDVALRIRDLEDSALLARRLCPVRRILVGAPAYLERRGRPTHPRELERHECLGYTHLATPGIWRFVGPDGEEVSVRPSGRLRTNNADAMTPALLAGLGLALQPDFVAWREIQAGRLEAVMCDWEPPPVSLSLVTPPGGPRPARLTALLDFLAARFARPAWLTDGG
jgi:DNA-binding transcriptional LysR family regulator